MNDQPENSETSSVIDQAPSIADLVERTRRLFDRQFGRQPRWIAAAPGRVNLIGEHTDYNDGFVLPMAIDRYVVMAADGASGQLNGTLVRLHSSSVEGLEELPADLDDPKDIPPWTRYVYGTIAGCREAGIETEPLDIVVESTVPLGGGLSSSAALEVATATLLEAVSGKSLDPVQKALLCQKAEHVYAGMPCGIMDQFTSVMGRQDHLMLLDCRSQETRMVPLSDPDVTVVIINTNVKHELTGGEYAERRSQCEQAASLLGVASLRDATIQQLAQAGDALAPVLQQRARHVIGEIDRTTKAAECLQAGDWDQLGRLMYASHDSLRDDYQVSCDELDLLVELAAEIGQAGGVIGSRMTGGGFGGCTVSLVRRDAVASVAKQIHAGYQQTTNIEPTVFTTRPAQGAHIVPS